MVLFQFLFADMQVAANDTHSEMSFHKSKCHLVNDSPRNGISQNPFRLKVQSPESAKIKIK